MPPFKRSPRRGADQGRGCVRQDAIAQSLATGCAFAKSFARRARVDTGKSGCVTQRKSPPMRDVRHATGGAKLEPMLLSPDLFLPQLGPGAFALAERGEPGSGDVGRQFSRAFFRARSPWCEEPTSGTASLSAFDGRRRTTVLALDLDRFTGLRIAAHAGFAVRLDDAAESRDHEFARGCPLASFTASLKSSSKKSAAVFLGVPAFSAMCETTLVFAQRLGCHLVFLSS